MYERFVQLLQERGITPYRVAKDTGIGQSSLTDWKTGRATPKIDKLQKIADYFGVSLDWLTGASEYRTPQEMWKEFDENADLDELRGNVNELTKRDEKDIAKKLDDTLRQLEEEQESLMFYGEPLDDETKELLIMSLERSIRVGKAAAKEKFTPKKYKKDVK